MIQFNLNLECYCCFVYLVISRFLESIDDDRLMVAKIYHNFYLTIICMLNFSIGSYFMRILNIRVKKLYLSRLGSTHISSFFAKWYNVFWSVLMLIDSDQTRHQSITDWERTRRYSRITLFIPFVFYATHYISLQIRFLIAA